MDLARKNSQILHKKSQVYLWNLLIIAVFCCPPVVQLVLYQGGNQDLCYYNFLCAHLFGLLSDFNHVFSNIGYVLGIPSVFIMYCKDIRHRKSDTRLDKYYGTPQHYGLCYAMGAALGMEGVLNGCYHVCPNQSNFERS